MKPAKYALPTRLVLVVWLDAMSGDANWKSWKKAAKQEPLIVHSVGYVVREEPGFVTVAASLVICDGTLGGDVTIPRAMIQSIQDLEVQP